MSYRGRDALAKSPETFAQSVKDDDDGRRHGQSIKSDFGFIFGDGAWLKKKPKYFKKKRARKESQPRARPLKFRRACKRHPEQDRLPLPQCTGRPKNSKCGTEMIDRVCSTLIPIATEMTKIG